MNEDNERVKAEDVPPILITKDVAMALMNDGSLIVRHNARPFEVISMATALGEMINDMEEDEFCRISTVLMIIYSAILPRIEGMMKEDREENDDEDD